MFKIAAVIGFLLMALLHSLGKLPIRALLVTSDSMNPVFSAYDVLLVKSQEHYAQGEIISFWSGNSVVTHRIVGSQAASTFLTKGDANATADGVQVHVQQIIGTVWVVLPKIGILLPAVIAVLVLSILLEWIQKKAIYE